MQTTWLKKEGKSECILFFTGWGMDPTPFIGVPAKGSDLCMVCDYRRLAPVDLAILSGYERLHLIAWSMGVWVAAHLMVEKRQMFTSLTAIGGTLKPIDPKEGIPRESYQAMLTDFGQETVITSYSIHYTKLYEGTPQQETEFITWPGWCGPRA